MTCDGIGVSTCSEEHQMEEQNTGENGFKQGVLRVFDR